jgi:hypothetical protein
MYLLTSVTNCVLACLFVIIFPTSKGEKHIFCATRVQLNQQLRYLLTWPEHLAPSPRVSVFLGIQYNFTSNRMLHRIQRQLITTLGSVSFSCLLLRQMSLFNGQQPCFAFGIFWVKIYSWAPAFLRYSVRPQSKKKKTEEYIETGHGPSLHKYLPIHLSEFL